MKSEVIVLIISPLFQGAETIINFNMEKLPQNTIRDVLESSFEYEFVLCKDKKESFTKIEMDYFSKGYRAYIRPYDTAIERKLAQELVYVLTNFYELSPPFQITFLYKQEEWNSNIFKTYYESGFG